jgi:hypothetical protein
MDNVQNFDSYKEGLVERKFKLLMSMVYEGKRIIKKEKINISSRKSISRNEIKRNMCFLVIWKRRLCFVFGDFILTIVHTDVLNTDVLISYFTELDFFIRVVEFLPPSPRTRVQYINFEL